MCVRRCYQRYGSFGITLLIYLQLVHSWRPYDTEFKTFRYEVVDHKAIKHITLGLKPFKNRRVLYGSMVLSKDMTDLSVKLHFIVQRSHAEDVTLLDTTVQVCEGLQQKNVNLVRIILNQFKKTNGYFPSKCPIQGNRPIVLEAFYLDPEMFPPVLPELNFISNFHILKNDKYILKTVLHGSIGIKKKKQGNKSASTAYLKGS